jgi:hypothetical protein
MSEPHFRLHITLYVNKYVWFEAKIFNLIMWAVRTLLWDSFMRNSAVEWPAKKHRKFSSSSAFPAQNSRFNDNLLDEGKSWTFSARHANHRYMWRRCAADDVLLMDSRAKTSKKMILLLIYRLLRLFDSQLLMLKPLNGSAFVNLFLDLSFYWKLSTMLPVRIHKCVDNY